MKVLIIDQTGCGVDFAWRCECAGHQVKLWIPPTPKGERNPAGDNFVNKVGEWEPHMKWADIIFMTDNAKFMKQITPYFKKGFPIFGPTWEAAQWELNRQLGQDIMAAAGIDVIPSQVFTNYDQAISFVKKSGKRYVSKPSGDADKALSYVSKSAADMIFMLEYWKKNNKIKAPFLLQEFIPGTEFAVGGWFGHNGWGKNFLHNWEHKKFMNGNLGVNTGEMGTVMQYSQDSLLAQEMLMPITGALHDIGYMGYCDVAVIIDGKGNPWPLEFTMRPGWPCFNIQQSLHKGDPVEWMADLMHGFDSLEVKQDISCGVVLTVPDFPYSTKTKKELSGIPIYGITESNIENLHPGDIQIHKDVPMMNGDKVVYDECWVSAGDYLATVTGTGATVTRAVEKCYKTIKQLDIPSNLQYRTDIGHRLEKELPLLQRWGYAKEAEY